MFWKIFSGIWLCSWKYHRKHIFYLLHTFSQLSNKYIISFLNTEIQKKQNPKKNSSNPVIQKHKRNKTQKKNSSDRAVEARSSGVGVDLCLISDGVDWRWCGLMWRDQSVVVGLELLWSSDWSSVWGVIWALSLSLFVRESGNGLKWKFSLQTISGSKPSKHLVSWK